MSDLDNELRTYAANFSKNISEAVTLDKLASWTHKQYEAAFAIEAVYHLFFAAKALDLKRQGFKNNQIAKMLLPNDYSQSRERTTKWVGAVINHAKKEKMPQLDWPIDPEKLQACLKTVVGSDVDKWIAVKSICESILAGIKDWPETTVSADITKAQAEQFIHVLLRESPGRPPDPENQQLFAEAVELKQQGFTNAQITKKLLPELYADPISRQSATDRIRKGMERHKARKAKDLTTKKS